MDASVSLPDPGEFHRPLQNGHAAGLVIDQLRPFAPSVDDSGEALGDGDLPGDGSLLPLDPADVSDVLAAPGFDLTPSGIDEQARLLEEEFRAELDLLPGFETLTWRDLQHCPAWCADVGLPAHGDGFDTGPESEIPHRGVPHDIPIKHGGKSLDHAGRAEVSAQLEQERDLATGPVITLSVVVRGIEQYAWLTTAEAKTLHRTLGQMLDDADGRS